MVIVIISALPSVGCGVDSDISCGVGVIGGVSDTATGSESSCCNGSTAFDNGLAELEKEPVWQADNPDRIDKPITVSLIIDRVDTLQRVNIRIKKINTGPVFTAHYTISAEIYQLTISNSFSLHIRSGG
jgi:hypothetical protein